MATARAALLATAMLMLASPTPSAAIDNGVGLTPPMGWRHWKAFYADISQEIMEDMMDEMAKPYPVAGEDGMVSLKDLGYLYVGLDDHWQNCTMHCANGTVIPSWETNNGFGYKNCDNTTGSYVDPPWYDDDGNPRVDTHRFPDLKGMVTKAHDMGLRAGWYFGNFQCRAGALSHLRNMSVRADFAKLAAGSVRAIAEYGFDSVKLDSGFPVGGNLTLWAELLNKTGRPVMIENCHQGGDGPGTPMYGGGKNCSGQTPISDCPFNFWRTTGDPEPGWGTIMRELGTLRRLQPNGSAIPPGGSNPWHPHPPDNLANSTPRSRPGGWAYPGTMVVGDGSMTYEENQVHFGGWCIVSSPLILAFNLSDATRRDLVWDIITNKEAIQVNQAWAGHPGSQVLAAQGNNSLVEVWTKPLGHGRTAAFIINTADKTKLAESRRALQVAGADRAGKTTAKTGPSLAACDVAKASQRWLLSAGASAGSSTTTNLLSAVNSTGGPQCMGIHACATTPDAELAMGGCKHLPAHGCSHTCNCNTAFALNSNLTITSPMDGNCIGAVGSTLRFVTCDGSAAQRFSVTTHSDGTLSLANGGACIDSTAGPAPPPGPRPGPRPGPVTDSATITIQLEDLGLGITGPVKVRDVWKKRDLPTATTGTFSTTVPHHGSVFLVFMPPTSTWPEPFELAPWMRVPPPPVAPMPAAL